ncbi:MFS transporter [Natribacillus halophilus]|uniref:MFS transporter, YQGE family, putative transporter n=1 Tax=Natribacillus halophilus TaxID=549003 RepID=A0A1G8JP13_9BACI|nr:MFS transporter [Natribacillus halophilus]SDI32902.1 MFS transporter, YQGE family, putative transporter [Natribacillus halophilus]
MVSALLKRLLPENVEATKDFKLLLVIGGLYALSTALSNTFVNVYIWKQSGSITAIALYHLATVLVSPLAFFYAGRMVKRMDRTIVLRVGIVLLALFYFAVLLAGTSVEDVLLVLGFLLGLGFGVYWLAFNVLTFEITSPETRDVFNGYLGLFTSLAGMVGPMTAGIIIAGFPGYSGYQSIFTVSLLFFATAVALSFKFGKRSSAGIFRISNVWQRRHEDLDWRRVLYAHFFQGSREGVFTFLIVVWVYTATQSELALGTYGLITSAVSLCCYFAVGRFLPVRMRRRSIFIGSLLLYLAIFFIVPDPTYVRLITYGILVSAAYPLIFVPFVSMTYDIIGKAYKAASMRVEYLIVREWFVNGGRAVSIICFLILTSLLGDRQGILLTLLVFGAGHLFLYLAIRHIAPHGGKLPDDEYASKSLGEQERQT